jgi:hypothetical protein
VAQAIDLVLRIASSPRRLPLDDELQLVKSSGKRTCR